MAELTLSYSCGLLSGVLAAWANVSLARRENGALNDDRPRRNERRPRSFRVAGVRR